MSYMQPAVITKEVAEQNILTSFQTIDNAKGQFELVANAYGQMAFAHEAEFAKQIIQRSYTGVPNKDKFSLVCCTQQSIYNAVAQVADLGLSLNPKLDHAYLLPRRNTHTGDLECTLEPSYKGLIHLAIEGGAISHVTATVVNKADVDSGAFVYNGPSAEAVFKGIDPFNPPTEAGIYGAICTAHLIGGGVITTIMNRADINQAREGANNSKAWKIWFSEMAIKSCIRRASKLWPKPTRDTRFIGAIDALNKLDNAEHFQTAANEPVIMQDVTTPAIASTSDTAQDRPAVMNLEDLTKRLAQNKRNRANPEKTIYVNTAI